MLAGNTAISKAIMPQAAIDRVEGMSNPMPPSTSATPTITLISFFHFLIQGGVIL